MPNILFIILISILTLLISFISTKGTLSNLKYSKKWWKIVTTRGKVVIILTLTIISLLIWQNEISERKNDKKDKVLRDERDKRDSLINKGVDSNRKVLFKDLSEALSKQGLRLDTVTKKLESLKDSAKTIVINSPKDLPIIIVREDGIKFSNKTDSTIKLDVAFISTQASAKVLKINWFFEITFSDGSITTSGGSKLFQGEILMPKDQPLTRSFIVSTRKTILRISLALFGIYTATDNSKPIYLKDVYRYIVSNSSVGFMEVDERDEFFKNYNLK